MFAHPFSFFPFRNLFFCELSCCVRVCIQASVLLVGFLMFSVRLGGWYFISNKRECEFLQLEPGDFGKKPQEHWSARRYI